MNTRGIRLGLLLAVASPFAIAAPVTAPPAPAAVKPAAAKPAARPPALDRYYQLTFGRQIEQLDYDALVARFRDGASSRPDVQSCPALKSSISEFSENQFRKALVTYMKSPTLENAIKDRLAVSLTQQDLEAFLAFVDTPAGAKYLEHSQSALSSVEKLMTEAPEQMMESPEMQTMLGEMMAMLVPVMMKCRK